MDRIRSLLTRYWLFLLWLGFAPITAAAARHPGFVRHPEAVPYPWRAAIVTWGILGLESAAFYLILRLGRGIVIAFGISVLLLIASVLTTATDMPGYSYVPAQYQLGLAAILGIKWTARAVVHRANHSQHNGTAA